MTPGELARVVAGAARGPAQPRAAAAEALVVERLPPHEAWETAIVRGLIPEDWFEDPRRVFGVRWRDAGAARPSGRLLFDLAAMDPRERAAAEELAWETARRLAPWGMPAPARLKWALVGRLDRSDTGIVGDLQREVADAYARAARLRVVPRAPADEDAIAAAFGTGLPRPEAFFDALADSRWEWLARAGVRRAMLYDLRETRFEDLPDPFAPVLALWRLGLGVDVDPGPPPEVRISVR